MATPNYTELSALARSSAFIDRVSIAVAKFAQYILSEDPGTSGHKTRHAWAQRAILNPRGEAANFLESVAIDGAFTAQNPLDFATTPDTGAGSVQVAVEAFLNATILKF